MARLIFMTIDCRHQAKDHRPYKRGMLIDILRDDQFCGIEVQARGMFRSVRVPLATRERFEYLLEADTYLPGLGALKRRRRVDLDKIEAIGRKMKGGPLDDMDEIEIVDPAVIDDLAEVLRPAENKMVVG